MPRSGRTCRPLLRNRPQYGGLRPARRAGRSEVGAAARAAGRFHTPRGPQGGSQLASDGLPPLRRWPAGRWPGRTPGVLAPEPSAGTIRRAPDTEGRAAALASLRSRRGFEEASKRGWLRDTNVLDAALTLARNPISLAYLAASSAGAVGPPPKASAPIQELLAGPRGVASGSARHLALVEAVRRLYKRQAMEADRADTEAAERPI